jgi:RNA polymerase-binding transcription factor DksA
VSTSPAKKKAPAKKAPAKKSPAKKSPAKAPAKKGAAKKAPAKVPAKKAPAKKAPAKKTVAAKAAPTKAAPAKKATKAPVKKRLTKSPYDAAFLKSQEEALMEERATLSGQAQSLMEEADALTQDREPGDVQFDDESGEGDTLAVERDMRLARAALANDTVDEIDDALKRIVNGVYGICEYSGEPIPKERLKAIPWARERVEYKTRSFR